ncbi:MAG: hypothetical protein [Cressdnaviricota sp.]|nr:MAG: hypothetical protein [Cressdnaviricota sp.]
MDCCDGSVRSNKVIPRNTSTSRSVRSALIRLKQSTLVCAGGASHVSGSAAITVIVILTQSPKHIYSATQVSLGLLYLRDIKYINVNNARVYFLSNQP